MMKRIGLSIVLLLALVATSARGQIVYYGTAGQTLYVRFDDGSNTAVNLTEGSTLNAGRYVASNAAIVTATLASSTSPYTYRVLIGTAGAQASGDVAVGNGSTYWNGTITQSVVDKYFSPMITSNAFTSGALANAPSGSGLTAQQTADALKLAPSGGSAATGSAYDLIGKAEQAANFAADFHSQFGIETAGAIDITPAITAANRIIAMTTSGNVFTAPALTNAPTGGGGLVMSQDNTQVVPADTFKMGVTNADGSNCFPHLKVRAGVDAGPIWIDTSAVGGGAWAASTDGLASSSGNLAVSKPGVNRELCVLWYDATAAIANTQYTITGTAHVGGKTKQFVLKVDAQ